ncbi:beta-ketoacyl-[acyl-carrier-protein] synthase family protein [Xylella taiwanensis]|uniref:Beta-ketoacyl-[acyl-carrier-protein] synthase family protein n=2 Tax=Xylella taiwanensis TaxID=1444770 RepID=A0ABS8TUL7_9GAMM|nr:beta-ketoacyl-[acyl-carrier-protein] synthase family protein [Xylella taiwanensis]MCD8456497.1 beta-ketoacyl-[acyl-carrier-protein] synthase family protein [Xylella taiwanensis]MCD8458904.1 beta-ketoacyl-[acyl-carrier-protein] synthase family protein [Xylella taiwanensis]MCD8461042.1 beta-ketoacyl-[acyl-carrier-protein] synthase family protein [Xylella taiwanensis]MCD8462898.1 beta-ketoacyl-[acyl-carrier-protein] synthase family protein [Xylella taiwanensis]MCD8465547.1 beta-ketoacyl-[acyl-
MSPLQPSARMVPIAITAFTATTAVGTGQAALAEALRTRRSGLRRNDFGVQPLTCWIGRVDGLETMTLPQALRPWECRNNRLAWLALQQDRLAEAVAEARTRYGKAQVAVIMGTSTSSIGAAEEAYTRMEYDAEGARFPDDMQRTTIHSPHSLGNFVQHAMDLCGPCVTVATACSSSAKVFAQAARLITAGVVRAALVGGVDTLCGSVLFGFNALQLIAPEPCRPFDVRRAGLSLGEAGGFALLERLDLAPDTDLLLCGYGESSDAYHMSAPHPEGLGARLAMQEALAMANVDATEVGYLNLHGTASPANDSIEAVAVATLFPATLHASSTKAWTGHTLGASGIIESTIALLALRGNVLPGTMNSEQLDPVCGPQIRFENAHTPILYAMNNSFGFGGNNCALLFKRTDA